VPDDVLHLVKKRNSLVMVNFSPDFISCVPSDSWTGLPDLYSPNVTIHQVVRHIKYIGELIGYDHVGFGSDFDGIQTTPEGLEDVSKYPDLVAELLREGVSDGDVAKVVGRNLLRVWKEADEVAQRLQKDMEPLEDEVKTGWGQMGY
jgi:membrane dipeptidase